MNQEKIPTNLSLTREARELLQALADKQGVSKSAVLELLIREKAKAEGVKADDQ